MALIKEVILLALKYHDELSVHVAQQGGWQGYERKFESELKAIQNSDVKTKSYRKLSIALEPARNPGIQLADFYAGACRDFILNPAKESLAAPYRLLEQQVLMEQSSHVQSIKKEKG